MTWEPLLLSYQVAAIATLVSIAVGVGLAALLARPSTPGREFFDALLTVPMLLPPTVLGYYLLVALGRKSWLGEAFEAAFGSSLLFTFKGCVVAAVVSAIPFVVKFSRVGIEGVDRQLVQAARTLGAGPARAFFTVTLPLAAPGIIAGAMLGFVKALGEFGVTLMVAGDIPGETQTGALAIYDLVMANQEVRAQGMIAVLTATGVLAMWGANRLLARRRQRAGGA
jgi:molybdate transport system permease protein